jgi:hypothetical protein
LHFPIVDRSVASSETSGAAVSPYGGAGTIERERLTSCESTPNLGIRMVCHFDRQHISKTNQMSKNSL